MAQISLISRIHRARITDQRCVRAHVTVSVGSDTSSETFISSLRLDKALLGPLLFSLISNSIHPSRFVQ